MRTVYAQATAPGRAGVAIVRLSGPEAWAIAETVAGPLPSSRGVRLLRDADAVPIDEALVLNFAAGASFTGEPIVEFQTHGSPAIVKALGKSLELAGAAPAPAGEFTRRALINGRLDLVQVEGLADLIDAETEMQRRQALRVFSGELGDLARRWRQGLVRAGALIEATIDFADEDVPVDVQPEVTDLLTTIRSELDTQLSGAAAAERVRDGFEVALIGAPNVGKSSLLNRLAGREAAITSEVAGTTRDVIEVRMEIGGLPVTLLDTAGLRETTDPVERIGVSLARERAAMADLRVLLLDGTEADDGEQPSGDLVVRTKSDISGSTAELSISSLTGAGIERFLAELTTRLEALTSGASLAVRERHVTAMAKARGDLDRAINMIDSGEDEALIAHSLRLASAGLAEMIGIVHVEDLLDDIFASFCIGK